VGNREERKHLPWIKTIVKLTSFVLDHSCNPSAGFLNIAKWLDGQYAGLLQRVEELLELVDSGHVPTYIEGLA
jgi:hypothetical protein